MSRITSLATFCALCAGLLVFTCRSQSQTNDGQQPADPLAACWQDLASSDAAQAYRATWLLAQHPAEAVKLLREQLKPAPAPDVAQIQSWLTDLDSEKYAVRVKAVQELEKQGELAEPQLRKTLEANPPLETRQRVQKLLDRLQGLLDSVEKLRMVRAVEVLELLATDDAKELLQQLAKGFAAHRLTKEANESLERLERRPVFAARKAAFVPSPDEEPLPFGVSARLGTTRFRKEGNQSRMSAAFSADGRFVASPGINFVYIWETKTGKVHRKLNYKANSIAMSPRGTLMALGPTATGDKESAIVIWDLQAEKELGRIPASSDGGPPARPQLIFAFNEKGTQLLVLRGAPNSDNDLCAWDIKSLKSTTLWKGAKGQGRMAGFSRDGNRVAIDALGIAAARIVNLQPSSESNLEGGSLRQTDAVFSPNGKYLAGSYLGGSQNDGVRIWDAVTGNLLRVQAMGSGNLVRSLAFSVDSKMIAASFQEKGIFLWEAESGKFLKQLPDSISFRVGAFSPDSHQLVGVSESSIRIWDLETGKAIDDGAGHVETIWSMAVSPRFDAIATAGHDGSVRMWDPHSGKQTRLIMNEPPGWVSGVAFSPDGKWLATSDLRVDSSVRIWEVESGRQVFKLPGHGRTGGYRKLQFSSDSRYLSSSGDDFYVRKWDVKTGKAVLESRMRPAGVEFADDEDGRAQFAVKSRLIFLGAGEFSPSGEESAIFNGAGSLHFFAVATGKETRVLNTVSKTGPIGILSICFSPKGKHVLLCGNAPGNGLSLTMIDSISGKVVLNEVIPGRGQIHAEFSPDGRTVAATLGSKILVIEAATGKVRVEVDEPSLETRELAYSSDGRSLVTAMNDSTILVWDLAVLAGRKQP